MAWPPRGGDNTHNTRKEKNTMGKFKMKQPKLTKSKARVKKLGEVFTPPELVTQMLNDVPTDAWEHDKTFLEPSCGNGNFLVQILERKLAAGATPLQALATMFAIDIDQDNIDEARDRLFELVAPLLSEWNKVVAKWIMRCNIVCGDALQTDHEKLFCSFPSQQQLRSILDGDGLFFQKNTCVLLPNHRVLNLKKGSAPLADHYRIINAWDELSSSVDEELGFDYEYDNV